MFPTEQAAREVGRQGRNVRLRHIPCNTGSAMSSDDTLEYAYASRRMSSESAYSSTGVPRVVTIITARRAEDLSFVGMQKSFREAIEFENIFSPADAIACVRDAFGLNVSEASRIFLVERPTIYLWSNSKDMSTVRVQNRERIKQLVSLARRWKSWGRLPAGSNEAYLLGGTVTLLDLLSARVIEEKKVHEAHLQLTQLIGQLKQLEHEKAKAALKGLRASFKRMGDERESRKKGL